MLINNIKRLMTDKKITAKKLSEIVGVSPTHISYILNNKREPSIELLGKIAAALGVSLNEIFLDNTLNTQDSSSQKILDAEKRKQIDTIAAHLEEKDFTPKKLKLLNDYIEALFSEDF